MTDENVEAILRMVRLGMWPDRAAQMQGINPAAMRKHKERHPDFVTALEKAESEAEGKLHARMLRYADPENGNQWTACAWMLERRWPERYGRHRPEVQVNVEAKATANAEAAAEAKGPPVPEPKTLGEHASRFRGILEDFGRN